MKRIAMLLATGLLLGGCASTQVTPLGNREGQPPPNCERLSPEICSVVYTQAPEMLNGPEVARATQREYSTLIEDTNIGGTTIIHVLINKQGIVERTVVGKSSSHIGLDEAALRVGMVAKFRPAKLRDKPVALWIQLAITFTPGDILRAK